MSEQQPVDETPPAELATSGSRRNSALVATGIFLSRVSGLARERAIAHFFGTGIAADAFGAAFKIPNLLQNLLGEGVLSASFIPVYSRLLAEGREEEAGRVAGAIAGLLTATVGVLVVVGMAFARPLTRAIAWGLPETTFELTVPLVRIMLPGMGFLVLAAWCLGILNSHRRFFLSYVAPVLLNATQVAVLVGVGTTILADELGAVGPDRAAQASLVTWLAWGTVAGGLLQFLVQLPAVVKVTRGLRPSVRTDLPGVRRTIRAFGPIVGGRGVVQLSAYLDIALASFLAAGALAAVRYGQVLYVLPISLFGMSVAAAELPALSSMDATERSRLVDRLDAGLSRVAFFVIPTVVGYLLLGDLVIATLFQTGRFDRLVTVQVWVVLGGYTVGLLASTASRLLQSALYGIGDARGPAVIAAIRVSISAALGVVLMFQLDRVVATPLGFDVLGDLPAWGPIAERGLDVSQDAEHLGAAGLGLAAGLASWVEFGLLRRRVAGSIGRTRFAGGHAGKLLTAGGAAAAAALAMRLVVGGWERPLLAGPVAVVVTGAAYLGAAYLLDVPELHGLVDDVRRRLGGGRGPGED